MRLVVADYLSNVRLGEWRPAGVKWSLERDKPGTISGRIIDPHPSTLLGRPTALYVVYPDGSIPWSGIVWGVWPETRGENSFRFEGAGWNSILDFRIVRQDLRFDNSDQAAMVQFLLALAEQGSNASLQWTVSAPLTGRKRDLTIVGSDRKSVLKYLTDWCDNLDGYDFRARASGSFQRTFELQYPRDHRAQTTVVDRPGIEVTRWEDDWTFVASTIDGIGETSQDAKGKSTSLAYTRVDPPMASWPRMDQTFKADSVSVLQTLKDKTNRFADLHSEPLYSASVRITDGPTGVLRIGEDIRLVDSEKSHRDEVFQLTKVEGEWIGAVPVETWTLEQTARQVEV